MNDHIRGRLADILRMTGHSIFTDTRRCEGLVRDICGKQRREANLLISALREQIPAELMLVGIDDVYELKEALLAKRLAENLAMTHEAAVWAVRSWAIALDIITDEAYEPKESIAGYTNTTTVDSDGFPVVILPSSSTLYGYNSEEWILQLRHICLLYSSKQFRIFNETDVGEKAALYISHGIPESDEIISFLNCPEDESVKTGLAICESGIYWRNAWNVKSYRLHLKWNEYRLVRIRKIDHEHVELGGGNLFKVGTSSLGIDTIMALLKQLQELAGKIGQNVKT